MKLENVLDQIKDKNQVTSNGELGRILEINTRRLGEYYGGKRAPTDDDYAKIAMASGRRVDELQAMVKLSIETDQKSREVWTKYYKSIGGYAASFMLMLFASVIFIITTPQNAVAKTTTYVSTNASNTNYALTE